MKFHEVPVGHIFRLALECDCVLRKVDDECFVLVEFCHDHPSPAVLNAALREYEQRFCSNRYRIASGYDEVTYDPFAAQLEAEQR